KRNTKRVGLYSELIVLARFAEAGLLVAMPLGDNAPYDLIVDDWGKRSYRIQVKTGRLRRGVVIFNCYASHWHRGGGMVRYTGRIDAFAVYCPDTQEVYLVPIDAPPARGFQGSLRTTEPRNLNQYGYHRAQEYRFDVRDPLILLRRPC
ncbi:MAG: hypothetical protein JO263_11790, partial [Candidatus Eremiobacteraeota bacterium]|nr:hypothetical protein [Candidatus Eremiobacteraeota bacterium]